MVNSKVKIRKKKSRYNKIKTTKVFIDKGNFTSDAILKMHIYKEIAILLKHNAYLLFIIVGDWG